jgi:hypothetical protein
MTRGDILERLTAKTQEKKHGKKHCDATEALMIGAPKHHSRVDSRQNLAEGAEYYHTPYSFEFMADSRKRA